MSLRTHRSVERVLRPPGRGLAARARLGERAPFRESGYPLIMSALEQSGNVAEAPRVYDGLRCLLAEELGASPRAEIAAQHRRLLATSQ